MVAREFSVPTPPLDIPDDCTLPQFFFERSHKTRPARPDNVPCLIADASGRAVSELELKTRFLSLSAALQHKYNIKDNDVVCIYSPNDVDYPVAIWAIHFIGGIVTPANPGYSADELAYQLTTSKATLILAHPASLKTAIVAAKQAGIPSDRIALLGAAFRDSPMPTFEDLINSVVTEKRVAKPRILSAGEGRSHLAFLSFSSGTTGRAKAVAISHYNMVANIIQTAAHFRLTDPTWEKDRLFSPGEVATGVTPFFHIYGLVVNLHFVLHAGMTVVVMPKFNFAQFLKSIERHRITHLFVVPPQIVLLCKHPAAAGVDFSRIKCCMSGAAPLSAELTHQLIARLPNCTFGQGYGATETCATVCMMPPTRAMGTIGSAGMLVPGIVARIVKPDGTLAGIGEQGELVVAGPSMALGYLNNEKANQETFVKGWVHTGDEVIINDKYEVFVVDRLKEIIKVKGFQVAPAELEDRVLSHPDVADVCVVSILDEYSGELPLAYVVLNDHARERVKDNSALAQEVKSSIQQHVSSVKVPYKWLTGGVEFIPQIPKSPSGKILRRILRDEARKAKAKIPAKL